MDMDSQTNEQEFSRVDSPDHNNGGSGIDHLHMPVGCGLCGRTLYVEDEVYSGHQTVSTCDDCKFLLLEDFGTPAHNSRRRRLSGRTRSTNGSSESIENIFSQQFSQIINLARHTEPVHEDILGDIDPHLRLLQPVSARTTPNGSRRWRRMISDTESDGFNSDSFYGENESNVSFGGAHRVYYGDSDAISYNSYEGDSDASVDGHTYMDTDMFVQSMERSDIGSDSDIDPMHAGDVQWDFDDPEEVEHADWEELDAEENVVGDQFGTRIDLSGGSDPLIRHRRLDSPESTGIIRWRIREVLDLQGRRIGMDVEEPSEAPYIGDPGNYLDARGFEEYLEHLAQADSSRQGAPPAATSFVDNLPLIVISEEHQKPDDLACAICKDLLSTGTEVNQLPCLHLYHPACILPWLSTRNSCPLCRYELPTDDINYEQDKRTTNHTLVITEVEQQDDRYDSSSVITESNEIEALQELGEALGDAGSAAGLSHTSSGRGGWLFLAAAPIVSLMGIVFVLWLGNPLAGRSPQTGQHNFHWRHSQRIHTANSCPRNQRERRWWWF